MTTARRQLQRILAALLLALVVSPLTAPFAAGHPLDLLGGTAPHVQSKKGPDDPVVSLSVAVVVFTPLSVVTIESTVAVGGPDLDPHTHALPLRL